MSLTVTERQRITTSDIAAPDYWEVSLLRIQQRRELLMKKYTEDDPQLWAELERLAKLEDFAIFSKEEA